MQKLQDCRKTNDTSYVSRTAAVRFAAFLRQPCDEAHGYLAADVRQMPGWRTITSVVRTPCVCCSSLAAALRQPCVSCGRRTPLRKRKQIAKKMNMSKIRCGSLATLFFVRQSCGVVYYTVRLPHEIQKFVDVDRCTAAARLM